MIDNLKAIAISIVLIVLGVGIAVFVSYENKRFNDDIKNSISNNEKNYIIGNYSEYQKYFQVNKQGQTILKVSDFNTFIDGTYYSNWHVNNDFDLCLGYYVIDKLEDGSVAVDDSHICDYID